VAKQLIIWRLLILLMLSIYSQTVGAGLRPGPFHKIFVQLKKTLLSQSKGY